MSKISDDFEAVVADLSSNDDDADTLPGFSEFAARSYALATTFIRSAKYHFAGAAPWESGDQAIMATSGYMQREIIQLLTEIISWGITVNHSSGREEDFDYEAMFAQSEFQVPVRYWGLKLTDDPELVDRLAHLAAAHLAAFVDLVGFRTTTDKEIGHVWDVWYGALGSCSLNCYRIGLVLGQKWYEEQVLDGIMQASQSEVPE